MNHADRPKTTICCLCGEAITERKPNLPDSQTRDHVPTKQFYPESLRRQRNFNLWVVPAHKRCNNEYKEDEEYFYHWLYPLVASGNPQLALMLFNDIARRAKRPQSKALIRGFLQDCETKTKAGIYLPPPLVRFTVDPSRIHRVAIKFVQGLFYREHQLFLPRKSFKAMRLYESPEDAPEIYKISWHFAEEQSVCSEIFSYRHSSLDGLCYFTMIFWQSFMIGAVFEHPPETRDTNDIAKKRQVASQTST